MNINSKEFVTIAQEIHTNEISTKAEIKKSRNEISELKGTLKAIRCRISRLEKELADAEDSDEDGSYNRNRIERLDAEILDAEMKELKVENQLEVAKIELSNMERDLESVLDEKAQTLFQVRERARKESDNSKTAGKMYGSVYSDIGASLQNHIQMNLMSLSQAASILDGSVEEFVESVGHSSNEVNLAGNGASISNSKDDLLTSPLSALTLEEETDSSLDGKMSSSSMKNRNLVISKDTAGNTGKTYLTNTYNGYTKRKVKSDNIDKEKNSQNISWSDIEYVDTSDKIKRANQNSKILEWKGEEGNSLRVPKNKSSQLAKILRDFGVEGISYINGDGDFSQVAKHEIKFVDAGILYFALEKIIKVYNINSRKDLNEKIRGQWQKIAKKLIVDKIIADDEFAKEFSAKTGMNTDVIKKQGNLRTELKRTGLTLHETADCKKIQIVSTTIHNAFKHYGGVSEMIERLLSGDIRGNFEDFSQVAKYENDFLDTEILYPDLENNIKNSNITLKKDLNVKIHGQWQKIANKQLVDRIVADEEFAKEFSAKTGMYSDVIKKQGNLRTELKRKGLTLYVTEDCKKVQIVPTIIYKAVKHCGNVSETELYKEVCRNMVV